MSRSQQLLKDCADAFASSKDCRFIIEATDGHLDDQVWRAYMENELSFVCTVHHLMKQLIAGAPKQRHAAWDGIIANLHDDQVPYLAGLLDVPVRQAMHAETHDVLSQYLTRTVQTGGYPAFAASMFAAENLYQQWCYQAWQGSRTVMPPALRQWVGMHVNDEFHQSVLFWNESLDEIDERIQNKTLVNWSSSMLETERQFHESSYRTHASGFIDDKNIEEKDVDEKKVEA
ncbi:hypothetical protein [Bifidobacterium aquikefiricola]|uniref:Aminopyrimidine aminohydrolase n=1 Tax=Bifidobacterium aquikefiricola TaxID=3059038 RepID=A0AB39U5G6_9BIFI